MQESRGSLFKAVQGNDDADNAADVELIASPGADARIYVTRVIVTVNTVNASVMEIEGDDGATATPFLDFRLDALGTTSVDFGQYGYQLAKDNNVQIKTVAGGAANVVVLGYVRTNR